jgi:dCTP deaminase
MILADKGILAAVEAGDIVIDPFDRKCLGTNSYDVRLGAELAWYTDHILDAKKDNPIQRHQIPEEGFTLVPNRLYLGVTAEYVESRKYVPFLDGKSSAGRLGISVHVTAGRGDVGFGNYWTMEIFVIQAVTVYANMPLGQFIFFETGDVLVPYNKKDGAKYHGREPHPRPSMMWKNFPLPSRDLHQWWPLYAGAGVEMCSHCPMQRRKAGVSYQHRLSADAHAWLDGPPPPALP